MTRAAWWWNPRHDRPSTWSSPSSSFICGYPCSTGRRPFHSRTARTFLRHPGPVQPTGVGHPRLGQVQSQGQRVVPLRGDGVDGHGGLAVGLLPQPPAVLPLDPDRRPALFRERRVADHEHRVRIGERGGRVGAVAARDDPVVPGAVADELLDGLLRVFAGQPVGPGDAAGEGLDALAVAVGPQAVQVHPGPPGRLGLGESAANRAAYSRNRARTSGARSGVYVFMSG